MPNSLLYAIATLIWGSTWLAITFQFGDVPATASVAYRFIIAGSLMLVWCKARGLPIRMTGDQLRWASLQGALMFGFSYMLVYEAERHIPSGLVAVLNSSMVVINLIGARLAFGRHIDRKSAIGASLGVVGIVLVFWPELALTGSNASLRGVMYGLCAAMLASSGNLVAQRNREAGLPLLPTIGVGMLVGGSAAILVTLLTGHALTFDLRPGYIASLAYLAIFGSVLAFGAYLTLLGRIGAARAGYVAVAVPVVALLLSAHYEHYVWHPITLLGILFAIVGNIVMLADIRLAISKIRVFYAI